LTGCDSFLARKFFSVSRPINETARCSARVIHCASCRQLCYLPPKQLNHFKALVFPTNESLLIDPASGHLFIKQFFDAAWIFASGIVVKFPWATHRQGLVRRW
jgi:hypothetical protein